MEHQENNTQNANQSGASEDIVQKVMSAPNEAKQEQTNTADKIAALEQDINKPLITQDELSKIKDPFLRQFMENKNNEMVKGMNEKFRKIAELGKSLEQAPKQQEDNKWTLDRLERTLQDPNFLSVAEQLAQNKAPSNWDGNDEEWSVLSTSEKAQFKAMQNTVNNLTNTIGQFEKRDIDSQIKSKLPSYDPSIVDHFEQQLASNQIGDSQRREVIFKAYDYENAIRRAYNMGREESSADIKGKFDASTIDSSNATQVSNLDTKGKSFSEIARERLKQLGK